MYHNNTARQLGDFYNFVDEMWIGNIEFTAGRLSEFLEVMVRENVEAIMTQSEKDCDEPKQNYE